MTLAQPETTGVPAACTSRAPAGIRVCSTRAQIGVLEEKERGGRRQAAGRRRHARVPATWGRLWDLRASGCRLQKGHAVLTPGRLAQMSPAASQAPADPACPCNSYRTTLRDGPRGPGPWDLRPAGTLAGGSVSTVPQRSPLLPCRPCRPQERSGSCLSSLACREHSTQSGWDCWYSDGDTLRGRGPESPTTCLRCLPHLPVASPASFGSLEHHNHSSLEAFFPSVCLPVPPCKPPGAAPAGKHVLSPAGACPAPHWSSPAPGHSRRKPSSGVAVCPLPTVD